MSNSEDVKLDWFALAQAGLVLVRVILYYCTGMDKDVFVVVVTFRIIEKDRIFDN